MPQVPSQDRRSPTEAYLREGLLLYLARGAGGSARFAGIIWDG